MIEFTQDELEVYISAQKKEAQKQLLEELAIFCESEELVIDEIYLREKKEKLK